MPLKAGFAEIDITPAEGSRKIGSLRMVIGEEVLDPLAAKIAVFESAGAGGADDAGGRVAFIQLDALSVRWTTTREIRDLIEARTGFPGEGVMVAASHNHAGPAMANVGDVPRDEPYLDALKEKLADAFAEALDNRRTAEVGFGSTFEFRVSFNRRTVMRDGVTRTQQVFDDPDCLYVEGPIDPEVAVLAARDAATGDLLGTLVNFACHPVHHSGERWLSAGYPGVLSRALRQAGCPVTVFLNGACGNIMYRNLATGEMKTKEEVGETLAEDVKSLWPDLAWRPESQLEARRETIDLPYRQPSEAEMRGEVRGAQRFVDSKIYDRAIPAMVERARREKAQPAEVQVLSIDEIDFVSIPAEYFVQHGLRIKQGAHPRHALVVSCANGMVGYLPHREAFERGGYETTYSPWSRMAPEAGDMLADLAIDLVRRGA